MKTIKEYFFCSPRLLRNVDEISEIDTCIDNVKWKDNYSLTINSKKSEHQTAYNKAFETEFLKLNWKPQPLLYSNPRLIGDFLKNDVFVEIQFGNSATIYREYYKFHYVAYK